MSRAWIINGNALCLPLADCSVQCVVTSPPYWGLRDYGVKPSVWGGDNECVHEWGSSIKIDNRHYDDKCGAGVGQSQSAQGRDAIRGSFCVKCGAWLGCHGLEPTPELFIKHEVLIFREVWRVLRPDGTLWLNLGDSYSAYNGNAGPGSFKAGSACDTERPHLPSGHGLRTKSLKPKDLVGIPWRVAFALQDDGWYLRSDIIWCISGGAWIYARTQKGDMPVMVKDLVRLDPSTVSLWNGDKWTRVLGWGPSNDETERLEIVLRSGERIGCTGGHQWPTDRGNVAARELRIGDVLKTSRIPEPDHCVRPPYLTDDALWLIGLYLAEGNRANGKAQLSLSADEHRWIPRIESVAKHYGCSSTFKVSGGSLTVRLHGSVLSSIINAYIGGSVAIDKHLKVACWRLPNDALRLLIQGYLDGDGHHDTSNARWRIGFCRNYCLERDIRTAAARLGATLTLKPCVATYQDGESPSFRGEWRWNPTDHHNSKDRGEIVEVRASRARKFWDIAVEDEPHLFALASGVLTHNCKPNPMPESVTDRPTKAHEYIFLLAKSERYYYDAEAIMEACSENTHPRLPGNVRPPKGEAPYNAGDGHHRTKAGLLAYAQRKRAEAGSGIKNNRDFDAAMAVMPARRNKRSVWTVTSQSYKGAHFATFPEKLVEPCILAGTSAKGCCPKCGSGWVRVIEKERVATRPGNDSKVTDYRSSPHEDSPYNDHGGMICGNRDPKRHCTATKTVSWKPGCKCDAGEPVPCVVLDPFAGTCTTGRVAIDHGRRFVGIELKPDYIALANERVKVTPPLFIGE